MAISDAKCGNPKTAFYVQSIANTGRVSGLGNWVRGRMGDDLKCGNCDHPITQTTLNCRNCGQLTLDAGGSAAVTPAEKVQKAIVVLMAWGVLAGVMAAIVIAFLPKRLSDAEVARKEADRRAGRHCLVGGYNYAFIEQVKKQLRDPSSFEHDKTLIDPVDAAGRHRIAMRFRARNGFGGMNIMYSSGLIESATCNFIVITKLG